MTVRPVSPADVIDLRHRVLRAGLARESAIFDGDDDPTTIHLAAFDDADQIVGVVTILQRPRDDGSPAWQLRGMAVDGTRQRGGVGAALLAAVDRIVAASTRSHELWCNARKIAIGFYERHGWRVVGDEFDIPLAGPHRVMTKKLR